MYGAVEQMRAIELQQAGLALSEAEGTLAVEREMSLEAMAAGREALGAGSRAEWLLTEIQQEYLELRRGRLEGLREERAVACEVARADFLESRVRTEQMKQVVKNLREQAEAEEARRAQAASDDRFLMRLFWRDSLEKRERD
jgi:hypothetical protein